MFDIRRTDGVRRLAVIGALLALTASPARAWVNDQNANRIDDRIERVHSIGLEAAHVDDDPGQRLRFGVTAGPVPVFAARVRYGRLPNAADAAALAATGVHWTRPCLYIPYIRTEATFAQIEMIAALPGVTRVEVVPVLYALNHVGSRLLRARDSRGYVKAQNDVLFPSARQELGLDGSGITIAIFDTGVNDAPDIATSYPGHESLAGKFLGGGEFFYGNPVLNTPNTGSVNPQDHGSRGLAVPRDACGGHGAGNGWSG